MLLMGFFPLDLRWAHPLGHPAPTPDRTSTVGLGAACPAGGRRDRLGCWVECRLADRRPSEQQKRERRLREVRNLVHETWPAERVFGDVAVDDKRSELQAL